MKTYNEGAVVPVLFGPVNYRAHFKLSIYLWPTVLL